MIVFKRLRWKNLLSYGNQFTEIDLSSHKTSLIVGKNGVGKTTIIDALCFVLYNKSFRNTNKPLLINSITQKNMLVEVEFEVRGKQYFVRRGIKPNVFEIFKDGSLLDQTATASEYQNILEKQILKMNFKSFTQIVILGSSNYVPFMRLPAQARREIIEDLLDIQVFSVMSNMLKERVNQNKSDILENAYAIDLCKDKIELAEKHLEALKQNRQELIDACKVKISKLELDINVAAEEIDKFSDEMIALTPMIEKARVAVEKSRELIRMGQQIVNKHNKLKEEIAFYQNNTSCPTCKQDIHDDFRQEILKGKNEQLAMMEDSMKLLDTEYHNIQVLEKVYNDLVAKERSLCQDITKRKTSIRLYEKEITNQYNEIKNLETKVEKTDDITAFTYKLQILEEKKESLLKAKELFSIATHLLKDGGIKTMIVRQYIPVMNSLINKSLDLMNFYCQFTLDENFNEKINSRFRDEFNYESFSEGEKKRIDLALMFTWREISRLRNGARCNILIFDEILDSALDSEGMDDLIKIVKVLADDTNTIVISHKSDQFLDKFDRILEFKKHKNFSQMVAA